MSALTGLGLVPAAAQSLIRKSGSYLAAIISAALTLLSPSLHAVELQSSVISSVLWSADSGSLKRQNFQFSLEPEFILRFDQQIKLTALSRLRSISLNALAPEKVTDAAYSPYSKPLFIGNSSEFELREFYLEVPSDNYYFTLGKQQVVWGKADGLKVLDIVNPQSYREFILEDFDDSRIPQWMVNIETSLGAWDAQFLWIPDQSYHVLGDEGSLYTPTSPLLLPKSQGGASVEVEPFKRPRRTVMDSDVGLRLSRFWRGWDLSLNYLYQYDNFALLYQRRSITANGLHVDIEPQYRRTHVLGGSFSNAFDNWVIRGELAYFSDRYFLARGLRDSDGIAQGQEVSYVMGLDWAGLENTLISGQLFQSVALNRESATARDKTDTTMSLLVNHTLLNETMELRLIWLANTNIGDGLLRLRLTYEWRDNLKTWIANDIFYGSEEGIFGQFDANDRLTFGVEMGFE
ncbi:MAG: hypothetical protein KBT88_08685 [Gammaproteobacteria bacterium]|nr:hypothetical protein [Gammaproteobacteria bacterium]MBQ0839850.1 hypothetical protein [Gammaproteobacteria bacterium]